MLVVPPCSEKAPGVALVLVVVLVLVRMSRPAMSESKAELVAPG